MSFFRDRSEGLGSTCYHRLLDECRLLSVEEERALVKEYFDGKIDRKSLEDTLVLHNIQFALNKVKRYWKLYAKVWDYDDVISVCFECLYEIVKNYDPSYQCRFNTYVGSCICPKVKQKFDKAFSEVDWHSISMDMPVKSKDCTMTDSIADFLTYSPVTAAENEDKFISQVDKLDVFQFFLAGLNQKRKRDARFSDWQKGRFYLCQCIGMNLVEMGKKFNLTRARMGQLTEQGRKRIFENLKNRYKLKHNGKTLGYYSWLDKVKQGYFSDVCD